MPAATSSAVTSRPIGCLACRAARSAAGSSAASRSLPTHGVSAVPGLTQLTRIPSWMWSAAIASVSERTAPFVAEYSARCGRPAVAATLQKLTIAACADARRYGSAARVTRTIPTTLTSYTRCHSSSGLSATVPAAPTPALFTRMSMPPRLWAAASTAARTDASSVTSALSPRNSSVGFRSSAATRAPRAASSRAAASPIPDPPPVTTAASPLNSAMPSLPFLGGGLAADDAGQEQREEDHRAVDGLNPVVRHLGEVEDVADDAEEDHPGRRANHVAAPALQAHAADYRSGEDREDDALTVTLLTGDGRHPAGLHEPADRGEHAAHDVDADFDPLHLDAGRPGRRRVAADRVDAPADPVVAQEQPGQDEDDCGDDQRDWHLADGRRAEVAEFGRQVEQRLRLDDAVLHAGEHDRHAEGHDEPVQPALHDQQAVDQADDRADGEQHEDAEVGVELGAAAVGGDRHEQPGRDHRRQAERRLKRQVHAADQQDQALPDHDDAERGALLADAREVRHGEERGADQGPDDDQQHQHRQQRHLAQHADVHAAEPRPERPAGRPCAA